MLAMLTKSPIQTIFTQYSLGCDSTPTKTKLVYIKSSKVHKQTYPHWKTLSVQSLSTCIKTRNGSVAPGATHDEHATRL